MGRFEFWKMMICHIWLQSLITTFGVSWTEHSYQLSEMFVGCWCWCCCCSYKPSWSPAQAQMLSKIIKFNLSPPALPPSQPTVGGLTDSDYHWSHIFLHQLRWAEPPTLQERWGVMTTPGAGAGPSLTPTTHIGLRCLRWPSGIPWVAV